MVKLRADYGAFLLAFTVSFQAPFTMEKASPAPDSAASNGLRRAVAHIVQALNKGEIMRGQVRYDRSMGRWSLVCKNCTLGISDRDHRIRFYSSDTHQADRKRPNRRITTRAKIDRVVDSLRDTLDIPRDFKVVRRTTYDQSRPNLMGLVVVGFEQHPNGLPYFNYGNKAVLTLDSWDGEVTFLDIHNDAIIASNIVRISQAEARSIAERVVAHDPQLPKNRLRFEGQGYVEPESETTMIQGKFVYPFKMRRAYSFADGEAHVYVDTANGKVLWIDHHIMKHAPSPKFFGRP